VIGADSYLAEEALERLLKAAVGDERADAVQVFHGDETTWPSVLEAARTGSLFATRRAVVVRSADAIKGEGEELLGYLDDPAPGAALILMAVKPDKRKTLWKKILQRAQEVPAAPLKPAALKARVREEVRRRRLPLAEDGVGELIETVGQDLRRLMGEIEKLEAFAAGRNGSLSADDVAAVLGRGIGQPLYKMADALSARRPDAVLGMLEVALDEKTPDLVLLKVLHNALRQVRAARAMKDARVPKPAIAARLLPPNMSFKIDSLMAAASAWGQEDLKAALVALERADRAIKNGADARAALSVAVVAACGRTDPGIRPGAQPSR
jgi:DNA polymerase III subunit delta